MRSSTITALIGGAAVAAAVAMVFLGGSGQSAKEESLTPADIGKRLFRVQGCASCHTIGGGLSRGPDLAGLIDRLRVRLDTTAYQSQIDGIKTEKPDLYSMNTEEYQTILSVQGDERIKQWFIAHLKNPRFDHPEALMPSFKHLTPQQFDELTAFLLTLP